MGKPTKTFKLACGAVVEIQRWSEDCGIRMVRVSNSPVILLDRLEPETDFAKLWDWDKPGIKKSDDWIFTALPGRDLAQALREIADYLEKGRD